MWNVIHSDTNQQKMNKNNFHFFQTTGLFLLGTFPLCSSPSQSKTTINDRSFNCTFIRIDPLLSRDLSFPFISDPKDKTHFGNSMLCSPNESFSVCMYLPTPSLQSRAMPGHNAPVFSHSARACHMLRVEIKFIFSQQYEYKCKYSYCSTYARSYQVCIFGRFSYKVQFAPTCFPYVAYDKPQFI